MIRAFIFLFTGIGFLALLAYSWNDSPKTAALSPSSLPTKEEGTRTPASQPEAKPASAEKTSSVDSSRKEVQRLEACYISESCAFPQTDPHSYHFAVSAALASVIESHLEAFGPDAAMAQAEMANPEPTVQAAALKMLSALPPSPESLAAISTGLKNTPDASLVEQAVRELERYMGTSFEAEAQKIVGEIVTEGAHFSSQQAAKMLLPFINERSYETFASLLQKMQASSQAAADLRAALREYNKMHSGS